MSETTLTKDEIQAIRQRPVTRVPLQGPQTVELTRQERDALCDAAERAETLEAEVAKWNKCDSLVCPYEQRALQAEAQLTEVTRERDALIFADAERNLYEATMAGEIGTRSSTEEPLPFTQTVAGSNPAESTFDRLLRRAESAEAALAPLRAVVEAGREVVRYWRENAPIGYRELAITALEVSLSALPADPSAPTPR